MTQHPTPIPPPAAPAHQPAVDPPPRREQSYAAAIEAWERGRRAAERESTDPVTRAGLQREQAIRSDAAGIAATLLGDCAGTTAGVAARLVELAEPIADWIRDGSRPDTSRQDADWIKLEVAGS